MLPRPADLPEIPSGPPILLVLSGQSGAGKDSVRDLLIAWGVPVHFVVTATTRKPRPGEVEGIDYHFISESEFERLEREDGLIEHAVVYGQRKGIPRSEVLGALASGRDVLARVDVQGAATLKSLVPDALTVFLVTPSREEMRRRLDLRQTENETDLDARLRAAATELDEARHFDYVVVNETGRLAETARRVVEIISSEKAKRARAATNP